MKYKHIPKTLIPDDMRKDILKNGLIHFTYLQNAIKIEKEGLHVNQKNAMFKEECNMVWMYIYDDNTFKEKLRIVHKKGKRKGYDAVVIFKKVTNKQINNMRIRTKGDQAIVHIGDFNTKDISIKKLSDFK